MHRHGPGCGCGAAKSTKADPGAARMHFDRPRGNREAVSIATKSRMDSNPTHIRRENERFNSPTNIWGVPSIRHCVSWLICISQFLRCRRARVVLSSAAERELPEDGKSVHASWPNPG